MAPIEPMYVDAESGTYFTNQPIMIDVKTWTEEDWDAWTEEMSDSDRGEYAYTYGTKPALLSPSKWVEENK